MLTSNKAAALTLGNPRQQSGQEHICLIYKLIRRLRKNGNRIIIRWVSTSEDNKLLGLAKVQARAATQEGPMPYTQLYGPTMARHEAAQLETSAAAHRTPRSGHYHSHSHSLSGVQDLVNDPGYDGQHGPPSGRKNDHWRNSILAGTNQTSTASACIAEIRLW
jgi:hypothetical protein